MRDMGTAAIRRLLDMDTARARRRTGMDKKQTNCHPGEWCRVYC